jgi:WD40 repeat protein
MCPSKCWLPCAVCLALATATSLSTAAAPPEGKAGPPGAGQVRRDRHGDPLPEGAIARLGTVRFRTSGPCRTVSFAPDGRSLFAGGAVWDVATGRKLRQVSEAGEVLAPDGKYVAVVAQHVSHGDIPLYDALTGAEKRRFRGHAGPPLSALFTPDGKTLISAGRDKTIRFWDVDLGKETRRLAVEPYMEYAIALSPDGRLLASTDISWAKSDGTRSFLLARERARLWDVATGKEVRRLVVAAAEKIQGYPGYLSPLTLVAFTPDGKELLTAGEDRSVRVWDVATGKELRRFGDQSSPVWALAVSPRGNSFAVVEAGRTIRVRDLTSGRDLGPTGGHTARLGAVAVSPDGRTVATGSDDGTIRLWEVPTGKELRRLVGHKAWIASLVFARDGRSLFSTGHDETLRGWDLATGRELERFRRREPAVRSLAASADGKTLALAGAEVPGILLVDAATGKVVRDMLGPDRVSTGATFTSDGRTLLAWSRKGKVLQRWELATGRHRRIPCKGLGGGTTDVAFSPDGSSVCFGGTVMSLGSTANSIPLHDCLTGRERRRLDNRPATLPGGARAYGTQRLAFSPDGRALAWSASGGALVTLAELATGQVRQRFVWGPFGGHALAFSVDGRLLICDAGDTTALVWDVSGCWHRQRLSADELAGHWGDLAGGDAAQAYRALRAFAGAPAATVKFLRGRLLPGPAPGPEQLARLLEKLDSRRFAEREKAESELTQLGFRAESAMRKALAANPPLEVQRRLDRILGKLKGKETERLRERLRGIRAVECLEHIGTPEARQFLEDLARGAPEARLTQEARASLRRMAGRPVAAP